MPVLLVLLACLVLAAPASAQDQVPEPEFSADAEFLRGVGWDQPTVHITARGDGCFDYQGSFEMDDSTCVTMRLRLSRNGRVVEPRVRGFYDWADEDDSEFGYMGSHFYEFSCKRPGRWAWRVTYTNDSVQGADGKDFTATASGKFRVPRCVKRVPRSVGNGVAAEHAHAEVQGDHEDEFISQVHCSPDGGASRWVCRVRHNNTYRECVRRVSLEFFRRDEWRRKLRGYGVRANRSEGCRSF